MIVSLTKDEMITFYEIYEMFDELNVYDSKHEKDMLNGIKSIISELGDISGQFYNLMNQMKESDERIIKSIDKLTYTTSSLRKIGIFPLESIFLFSNLKVTFINLKIQNRLNLGGYMGGKYNE